MCERMLWLVVLQGAGLVDELTTCWAMISLKRCAELVRDMTISVPLYTGSIFEPVSNLLIPAYRVWLCGLLAQMGRIGPAFCHAQRCSPLTTWWLDTRCACLGWGSTPDCQHYLSCRLLRALCAGAAVSTVV